MMRLESTDIRSTREAQLDDSPDFTEFEAATGQGKLMTEGLPEPSVELVRLDLLPPDNLLVGDPPDAVFVKTLKQFGLLNAILLIQSPNGAYPFQVAAGRRRIKGMRKNECTEIRARVFPAGWTTAEVLTLVENDSRKKNALADFDAIMFLVREKKASIQEIAAVTGMKLETIAKRLRLNALIPELLVACRTTDGDGKPQMRVSVAEAAAKLPASDQRSVLLPLLAKQGHLTLKDVAAAKRVKNERVVATLSDLVRHSPSLNDIQEAQRGAAIRQGESVSWRMAAAHQLRENVLPLIPMSHEGVDFRATLEFAVRQLEAGESSVEVETPPEPIIAPPRRRRVAAGKES